VGVIDVRRVLMTVLTMLCAAACSSSPAPLRSAVSSPSGSTSTPSGPPPSSATSAPASSVASSSAPAIPHTAAAVLASMTEAQRVGQLLMVDCPTSGLSAATAQAIRAVHVGSIILDGTSYADRGTIRALTAQLENTNPSVAKLFIATDQEGGTVQRLQGAGFDRIPSAVQQGGLDPATLRREARGWGSQLRAAGVNVDLAPVLDTVPRGGGPNPPIGDLERQYGSDPATVATHGVAFAQGMLDAGVAATVKHFPGLGRVTGNTDTASGVTDTVTTRHDPYLQPFARAVGAGVPFVMVSTAIYSRIDPGVPAIFSRTIVTGMLRDDLGFQGVVITDDIGIAAQVSPWSLADRAVKFVQAGGDMILTVDAGQAGSLAAALLAKAQRDPAFKALVDAAALRVLQAKQKQGLLGY
jgi:beta-N-acetylhexosaminidase